MIIIDYSSSAIAALTGGFMEELKGDSYESIENIARHAILSTIKSYKKKFSSKFGNEIVIAVDNKHYWRRDFFSAYKHGRKKAKEDSGINWEFIHRAMDATKKDLIDHFPYKVIDADGAEADDVIGVIAKYAGEKQGTNPLFDDDSDPVLVITTDKDMAQLLAFSHVKIWNPRLQQQVKLDVKPKEFLKRLILDGDKGDGIPNVFSPANSFIDNIRQKPCTEKKMEPLLAAQTLVEGTTDETIRQRIIQNTVLIDFAHIPDWVKVNILEKYELHNNNNKMSIMKYLISKDMKMMLQDIEQF